jgi:hypothetical protein
MVRLIRDAIRDLDARARSLRERAQRANARVRDESERVLQIVEAKREALAARLEQPMDDEVLHEMGLTYRAANRLLVVVESWYRGR